VTTRGRRFRPAHRSRTGSWLLCSALIASLWRAPVPWIHTHHASGHHVATASLSWHLRHFHAHGDEPGGWHVHWTLPWDVFRTPRGDPDPAKPSPASAFEMPFVLSACPLVSAGQESAGPPAFLPLERESTAGSPIEVPPVHGLHFLQTYSASVPLRALICVALC
jgi:hypothetical protein